MRLIDADKLLRFFTVDTANQTYRFGTIKKQIENAETVQAIPIPDNTTNGDMIKAMFPSLEIANDGLINDNLTGIMAFYGGYDSPLPRGDNYFNRKWWNAPYTEKRGDENDTKTSYKAF